MAYSKQRGKFSGFGNGPTDPPKKKSAASNAKPAVNRPRAQKAGESDAAYKLYVKGWRESNYKPQPITPPKLGRGTSSGSSELGGSSF